MSWSNYYEVVLSFIKSSEAKYTLIFSLPHLLPHILLFFQPISLSVPLSLSLSLPLSLSLMMGVFLFCGGCELSEFVSVSIIPSLWAPAYKSAEGPGALSHRPPVSALSLLLYPHTATGKTVNKHLPEREKKEGRQRARITWCNA